MNFISPKVLKAMQELDRQVDVKTSLRKKDYANPKVEKDIAQGVEIADRIQEETKRLARAYEKFLETSLKAIVDALGCAPEELELVTYDLKPDIFNPTLFTSEQKLFYQGIAIMKYERFQEAVSSDGKTNIFFKATPLITDDETGD